MSAEIVFLTNPDETWSDIPNYGGRYKVSDFGRVMSTDHKKTGKSVVMSPSSTKKGYRRVKLSSNNISKTLSVHRLVLESFIPNSDNLPTINHINGVKSDNRLSNLEWSSYSDNIRHSVQVLGRGFAYLHRPIDQFSIDGKHIGTWESITAAHNDTKIAHSSISQCCTHARKTAGGYIWKYKN